VGLATAGGLAEIAAGVLGTAATWVASTGQGGWERGADSALGRGLREAGPWFCGGARCAAWRWLACCKNQAKQRTKQVLGQVLQQVD
jgi:hypothetical protein